MRYGKCAFECKGTIIILNASFNYANALLMCLKTMQKLS
jgi:hypothetical protein